VFMNLTRLGSVTVSPLDSCRRRLDRRMDDHL
jgi:hypothetical protein